MGVCILAKRVVLELGSSTNFVYSLNLYECIIHTDYLMVFFPESFSAKNNYDSSERFPFP